MDLIKVAEQAFNGNSKTFPEFKSGDTITVTYIIKDETKERLQKFRGVCIQRKGSGATETFTVRKMSNGVGVERIFPYNSPFIDSIEVNKYGRNLQRPDNHGPVAQLNRAFDYGSKGYRFESCRGR